MIKEHIKYELDVIENNVQQIVGSWASNQDGEELFYVHKNITNPDIMGGYYVHSDVLYDTHIEALGALVKLLDVKLQELEKIKASAWNDFNKAARESKSNDGIQGL